MKRSAINNIIELLPTNQNAGKFVMYKTERINLLARRCFREARRSLTFGAILTEIAGATCQ